jgi:hypothetical protein
MNPIFAHLGTDALGVVVSRRDVELLNTTPTLTTLRSLLFDRETVANFQGQVDVCFEGWDDDPREIYVIPEIRTFLHMLDEEFPYWLYFLSTEFGMLRTIALCLCHATRVDNGKARVEPAALEAFLIAHLGSMNRLFDQFDLGDQINKEISQCVFEYFTGRAA